METYSVVGDGVDMLESLRMEEIRGLYPLDSTLPHWEPIGTHVSDM